METLEEVVSYQVLQPLSKQCYIGQKTDHNSLFGLKIQGSVKINTLG